MMSLILQDSKAVCQRKKSLFSLLWRFAGLNFLTKDNIKDIVERIEDKEVKRNTRWLEAYRGNQPSWLLDSSCTPFFIPTIGAPNRTIHYHCHHYPLHPHNWRTSLVTTIIIITIIINANILIAKHFLFLLSGVLPYYPRSLVSLRWVKYGMSQTRNHLVWW